MGYIMLETPMIVILTMFIFTCCYAVRKGPVVMTKYSTFFVIITIVIPLFTTALLIQDMNLSNFFSMFSLPIKNYIQCTHTQSVIPSSGTLLFFMLFSDIQNPQKIAKLIFIGTTIGMSIIGFIITLTIIRMDLSLYERFPGKSLIEINNIVLEKGIGKFFSLMYILFFFSLTILNTYVICLYLI